MKEKPWFILAEKILEGLLVTACAVLSVAWLIDKPLFYSDSQPVMSVFTSLSLFLMVGVRLARKFLFAWPLPMSLAIIGLVLGGNVSSILMQTSMPGAILQSFSGLVMTSVMTSIGLVLFCFYELRIVLRDTPDSAFILDDILLHLAFVPGGLSLLGHLLNNPGYLSKGSDPRVGISLLEMFFMGLYAITAVLSNPKLFLWRFLAASWSNRLVFAALFANQFIAPLVVAWLTGPSDNPGPGLELFVMLAGVIATLSFLLVQAYLSRTERQTENP